MRFIRKVRPPILCRQRSIIAAPATSSSYINHHGRPAIPEMFFCAFGPIWYSSRSTRQHVARRHEGVRPARRPAHFYIAKPAKNGLRAAGVMSRGACVSARLYASVSSAGPREALAKHSQRRERHHASAMIICLRKSAEKGDVRRSKGGVERHAAEIRRKRRKRKASTSWCLWPRRSGGVDILFQTPWRMAASASAYPLKL